VVPEPTTRVDLPDGRVLAADDVGDPGGFAVISVHGTPDSRLARHPDDGVAAALGIRLVAVDRPGFGHSTAHAAGTVASFGDDVRVLADALGLDRYAVLAWSAGAIHALGIAARDPDRVTAVGIAAGLPPFSAYAEPGVLDGAHPGRVMLAQLGAELGAPATATELAPYLVPDPPTAAALREHLLDGADAARRTEMEAVPGAVDQLALAMGDSVRNGLAGITRDLELQIMEPDIDLAAVTAPVHLWYGSEDSTAPPAFGRWYEAHLPNATLEVFEGAGHAFPLPRWADLLRALLRPR
jgi:pimeloyl-ACP methyl ester carboxylesterase